MHISTTWYMQQPVQLNNIMREKISIWKHYFMNISFHAFHICPLIDILEVSPRQMDILQYAVRGMKQSLQR